MNSSTEAIRAELTMLREENAKLKAIVNAAEGLIVDINTPDHPEATRMRSIIDMIDAFHGREEDAHDDAGAGPDLQPADVPTIDEHTQNAGCDSKDVCDWPFCLKPNGKCEHSGTEH